MRRAWWMVLSIPLLATTPSALDLLTLAQLPTAERRTRIQALPRDEVTQLFAQATTEVLLDAGKKAAATLGTYQARLVKRERIDGKLLPAQTMQLTVREQPVAIRFEVTDGPSKGRKVVYDATVKKDELRAREGGFLGVAGPIWIGLDSSLARGDTNHPVTDLAMTSILRTLEDCFRQARPLGGYARKDEGLDAQGRYCTTFTAPPGGEKLYATRARICIEPALALPVVLEIDDAQGPLERLTFDAIRPPARADFSPALL